MSDEREPLWSDTRIEAELRRIGDNMRLYIADAATVAEQVRDEYEARIAELEQELAQRWEPLPDGAVTETTYGERVEIMTGSLINIIDGEDDCHGYELPDNIRLCRRVTQEPTP